MNTIASAGAGAVLTLVWLTAAAQVPEAAEPAPPPPALAPDDAPPDRTPPGTPPETPPGMTPPAATPPMTTEHLGELVQRADPDAEPEGNGWRFSFQERPMFLVSDPAADRMRIMTPIARVDVLNDDLMYRMLQANYDAVLDSRYAVANGIVWSAFIYPLSPLDDEQFASAVVQVYIAAATFGTTFTSGLFMFGGGDSQEENRKLIEALKKQLQPTT